MKKISTTYHLQFSKDDVIAALKLYAESQGASIDGEVEIDPEFAREYHSFGMFDGDYLEVFDGLKVTVTEFQNV